MAIQASNSAELRQEYLRIVKHLADRSREFLRSRATQKQPLQSPRHDDLIVCVDGSEVYRQNLETGRVRVQRFVPAQARTLQTAIEQPETLVGEVSVVCDRQLLHANINGWVRVDTLRIAPATERVSPQEPLRHPKVRPIQVGQAATAFRAPQSQGQSARTTSGMVAPGALPPATHPTMPGTPRIRALLLAASVLGIGAIFIPGYIDRPNVRIDREPLADRLREAGDRRASREATHRAEVRQREEVVLETAATRSSPIALAAAESLIEDLYRWLSAKEFDRAVSLYGPPLSETASPAFFNQFTAVTVENLQLVSQAEDSIDLRGENTYFYPDGSTQREVRSYTVRNLDGQLKIVSSEFIRVIKSR